MAQASQVWRAVSAAIAALPLAVAMPVTAASTEAEASTRLRVAYAPKAVHVTQDPDYVDWNHTVAVEWVTWQQRIWGCRPHASRLALFDNSYGPFSQSVYAGLEWSWRQALGGEVFLSASLGLVCGL